MCHDQSPDNRDAATPKPYAAELLPPARPVGPGRWIARIIGWLMAAGLLVLALNFDVELMRWRFQLMPQGPDGLARQALYGFRDFGQVLPILVAMVIILQIDRRRWTIVPAIIAAQILAGVGYNAGKLSVARYRPQPAINQVMAIVPDTVPELEKNAYVLSRMRVRQTWIGWQPINKDDTTQSFPSGHSAAAFAFAGVLAWFYPRLAITFWVLAVGCAASRYLDAVHWMSDCVAGASIGYIAAWLSLRPHLLSNSQTAEPEAQATGSSGGVQ